MAGQNVQRFVASGTINGSGEDLRFHSKGVNGHNGRYDDKPERHQEKVRDRDQYTQRGGAKTLERHDPRPFYTSLLTELQYLHRSVRGRFITGSDNLSRVLGGVMHERFVAPHSG